MNTPSFPNRLGSPVAVVPAFSHTLEMLEVASRGPGQVYLVGRDDQETILSYQQMRSRALRLAGALVSKGIRPGDRVGIILPTSFEFCDAFFGAQLAGAVPVPLYPPLRLGQLNEYHRATANLLRCVGARIVLTDGAVIRLLGEAIRLARPELGCLEVAALSDGHVGEYSPKDVLPSSLAVIQFSSGSTSAPRPVALTHANLMAQSAALKAAVVKPGEPPSRVASWLPLYHDMGLVGGFLQPIYQGTTLALMSPDLFLARPAIWLRAISRHRVTVSPAPNFAFALCVRRVKESELSGVDLSSVRAFLNGAEPISPVILEAFISRYRAHGLSPNAVWPVYGLAEATLAVTFPPTIDGRPAVVDFFDPLVLGRTGELVAGDRPCVSVGTPVAGVEVEVRDEHGVALPPRRVGRIHVRGPAVMHGYWGDQASTATTLVDGWLDTGDLGYHRGGELFVTGRAKDVIIIRGANRAPQEFEECLAGIPEIRMGCVVALGFMPTGGDGEELLLIAERSEAPMGEDLEGRVREAVLSKTGLAPKTFLLVGRGTLPRTSSGKLRRRETLQRYLAGTLVAPPKPSRWLLAKELARSVLAMTRYRLSR